MIRRRLRTLRLVRSSGVVVVAVLLGLAATTTSVRAAVASGVTTAPSGSQVTSFTFEQLGLSQSFSLAGQGSTVGIQLPAPQDLQPSALNGTFVVPPDFGTGTVVVESGTQDIGSVNLPPNADQQHVTSFSVDLSGASVIGNYESLTLLLEQANTGGTNVSVNCGSTLPVQLINPSVDYTGSFAAPDTIADFFPPVLDQLIIYVPPTPTVAEESAALTVAAAVAEAYQLVPVAVSVQPLSGTTTPALPQGSLVRGIVIDQTGTAGIQLTQDALGGALLMVTGSASNLAEQGTLLSATIVKLVQTTHAVVVHPLRAPTIQLNPMTFSQLGLAGAATFGGEHQLSFGIDETRVGGVASSINVDLKAEYSPVEAGAKATAEVVVGGVSLATQLLNGSGTFNLPFTIPGPLIHRSTNVILNLAYFPAGFNCGSGGRTMSFTIDPRSTIKVMTAAGGHGGFPDLPQSLIPTFEVAFDSSDWTRLSSAVQTVCGLQRMSTMLLQPTVVSLDAALGNQIPLLLIAAAHNVPTGVDPPLQYTKNKEDQINGASGGKFKMSSPLASLQVFDERSNSRTVVLATTSGGWQLMDSLFGALGPTSQVWSGLTGDVAAIGPSGQLVNLTVAGGGPQLFTASTPSYTTEYAGIVALFVLVVAALVVWAVVRYRRRFEIVEDGNESDPHYDD